MLKKYRQDRYESTVEQVIHQIEKNGFTEIKADFEGLESPAKLVSKGNNDVFIPDVTATNKIGRIAYFEIGRKVAEKEKLVNKWKLLEALANVKNGVFQIFVPHGSMKFTKEIVDKYGINAELVKL